MKILGISSFYHDSAAAITVDGEILAAAQEERFTRIKHDANFPTNAVKYCLDHTGYSIDQLDAVVFYDKPLLKFERLLETYYGFAPKGLASFIKAIPVWLREKMFLKRIIKEELGKIEAFDRRKLKMLFPEHHLSHAASAYYPSGFDNAAIITLDGVGEWATASICKANGKDITIEKELKFPHSLGLLYSAFTYFLGFRVNSGEYKLMGLAPYGRSGHADIKKYEEIIKSELIHIYDDGSIWLNQKYFNYSTGLRMVNDKKWSKLFGIDKREPESDLEQQHCDLGLAIQNVTEEIVIKMAKHAKELTGSTNLCMAGGVALNCVANGKLLNEKIFENIFIQPAAGDAGGALGAALAAEHIYFGKALKKSDSDRLNGSYLGPEYNEQDVLKIIRKYEAEATKYSNDQLYNKVAEILADGNAVGWFQGRMEFGPRALGGRSILGDPRNEEMQKKLNLKIKYRESFRPFAPSVLKEDVQDYFKLEGESPYMLLVQEIVDNRKEPIPADYHSLGMKEKLYTKRSDIPSVTHVDFSGRIQTVDKRTNPQYWQLINAFKELTGYALVVNTSFNVRGEPIVCTPEDAYRCFMRTEMDYLVINNYVFNKRNQPEWLEKDNWQNDYKLD
ncbi:carbamoyltransferase [Marivirga atlantica]|uniref:Carbamoyltransferase n=1 Tax=Marivirga atlantica TaxID=1548457 RepID=A0A937AHG1_9BACT|nr:carbamoyltransferase [Marivirga atlantica]MBL0766816.1 carbamoyltransferase [Marivirga atlantica]